MLPLRQGTLSNHWFSSPRNLSQSLPRIGGRIRRKLTAALSQCLYLISASTVAWGISRNAWDHPLRSDTASPSVPRRVAAVPKRFQSKQPATLAPVSGAWSDAAAFLTVHNAPPRVLGASLAQSATGLGLSGFRHHCNKYLMHKQSPLWSV